jgi:hypothetical protein
MTSAFLFFWSTFERQSVLARNDCNEVPLRDVPSSELTFRARASSVPGVLLDQAPQKLEVAALSHSREINHRSITLLLELSELIEHERHPAAHTSSEVSARTSEHDDCAARHVLAAMIADSLDYRDRAAVPDSEPLADNSCDVRFAGCRAVEYRVAGQNRLIGNELRALGMPQNQPAAGKSLADVIIGFSL